MAPARLAAVVAAAVVGVVVLGVLALVGAVAGTWALLPSAGAGAGAGGSPGPAIPPAMAELYRRASATCPGLPFPVLAAVGTVESSNGTSTLPGVHSGANAAGAEVIYRWVRGLRHVRDGGAGRRPSAVSASCGARRSRDGGLTRSLGCLAHDGQLSGVACGVSF